jgi:hypothetical protein
VRREAEVHGRRLKARDRDLDRDRGPARDPTGGGHELLEMQILANMPSIDIMSMGIDKVSSTVMMAW